MSEDLLLEEFGGSSAFCHLVWSTHGKYANMVEKTQCQVLLSDKRIQHFHYFMESQIDHDDSICDLNQPFFDEDHIIEFISHNESDAGSIEKAEHGDEDEEKMEKT